MPQQEKPLSSRFKSNMGGFSCQLGPPANCSHPVCCVKAEGSIGRLFHTRTLFREHSFDSPSGKFVTNCLVHNLAWAYRASGFPFLQHAEGCAAPLLVRNNRY